MSAKPNHCALRRAAVDLLKAMDQTRFYGLGLHSTFDQPSSPAEDGLDDSDLLNGSEGFGEGLTAGHVRKLREALK